MQTHQSGHPLPQRCPHPRRTGGAVFSVTDPGQQMPDVVHQASDNQRVIVLALAPLRHLSPQQRRRLQRVIEVRERRPFLHRLTGCSRRQELPDVVDRQIRRVHRAILPSPSVAARHPAEHYGCVPCLGPLRRVALGPTSSSPWAKASVMTVAPSSPSSPTCSASRLKNPRGSTTSVTRGGRSPSAASVA